MEKVVSLRATVIQKKQVFLASPCQAVKIFLDQKRYKLCLATRYKGHHNGCLFMKSYMRCAHAESNHGEMSTIAVSSATLVCEIGLSVGNPLVNQLATFSLISNVGFMPWKYLDYWLVLHSRCVQFIRPVRDACRSVPNFLSWISQNIHFVKLS